MNPIARQQMDRRAELVIIPVKLRHHKGDC